MTRVIHFEIPVDDVDRAEAFYENVFGWKLERQEGQWGLYLALDTGDESTPGISGAMYKRQSPKDNIVNVIDVSDIEGHVEKIKELGGEITFEICSISGVGYLAYFKDPAGNQFGMMKRDPNVKAE